MCQYEPGQVGVLDGRDLKKQHVQDRQDNGDHFAAFQQELVCSVQLGARLAREAVNRVCQFESPLEVKVLDGFGSLWP